LEVILVIAVVALAAGLSIPIYQSFQIKNELDIAAETTVKTLRRSQMQAVATDGDANWGIKIQTGNIVFFRGTSYAARDTAYDENIEISSNITPGGLSEIVFTKMSGESNATGAITLTSSLGDSRSITINSKGKIEY